MKAYIFSDTKTYNHREAIVLATSEPQARELLCLDNPTLAFVFRDEKRFQLLTMKDLVEGVLHVSEYHE